MVDTQIARRGIHDARVLSAMRVVPRHRFMPEAMVARAYEDAAVPIGFDQTISQPYIVAFALQALELLGTERALEIGTGCGYQTAALAECVAEVYSIEIVPELAAKASATLQALHYRNTHLRVGDGSAGWPEAAPFAVIVAAAAARSVPPAWIEQLEPGGRLIAPLGTAKQELVLVRKNARGRVTRTSLLPVRFVPLTGRHGQR